MTTVVPGMVVLGTPVNPKVPLLTHSLGYQVRPIQGATLPCSLRGYNLVATAETGSGRPSYE